MLAPVHDHAVQPLSQKAAATAFTDRAAAVLVRELCHAAVVYPIIALVGAAVAFGVGAARPDLARQDQVSAPVLPASAPASPTVGPEKLEGPAIVLTRPAPAEVEATGVERASVKAPVAEMPKRMPMGSTN